MAEMRVAFDLQIPSDVEYIEGVVELARQRCRELKFSPTKCSLNVPVALSEALSNAILRGNEATGGKEVRVRAIITDTDLVFEIVDEGPGFDLDECTRDCTTEENLSKEEGRGLFLMRRPDGPRGELSQQGERRSTDAAPRVKELEAVLIAFREGTHCEAAVWGSDARTAPNVIARSSPKVQMPDVLPDEPGQSVPTNFGTQLVTRVPSVKKIWLTVGPCDPGYSPEERHIKLLMPVVSQFTQAALEVEHAAIELAERYEEINLLYTIGEILGRTVTLEDAATTILTEISETVGARVASILVHDARTNTLQAVAALGVPKSEIPAISADDASSVSARVFRTQHPLIVVGKGVTFGKESPYGRGEMLSVPIMWTTPSGGQPLGVVNLADRRSRQPFSAGDQKLVTAIATQIGTAIQNARLVTASLDQQRLLQEMSLAHDLQMKLLPSTDVVSPEAEVTARVVPAESVGGDFYQLFKLRDGATGVMIGDVSGHGYRAALIMALAMSASAIHAQNIR